ncbi:MAG: lasso peptide [Nostocaceae cyanobacterium]|nr:lasso peptide [Nostocaceae cyanobacterium]
MKKTWNAPKITVYGSVENLTQKNKTTGGSGDGIYFTFGGSTSTASDYTSI